MTVVLLGPADDPQVRSVEDALARRGGEVSVWDTDGWPGDRRLTFRRGPDAFRVEVGGEAVRPGEVDAVYVRQLGLDPRLEPFESALEDRPFSLLNQLREYRSLLTSVLRHFEGRDVRIVNPVAAESIHSLKLHQLDAFADAGIPVPETLATNDPAAVESFVEARGDVVYKPVAGGGYARAVSAGDLTDDRLDRLSNAPVQFQERVDGRNLRLFVVDGSVTAAGELRSEALDYRTDDHDVEVVDPDRDVERAAVRAADALGLTFTGVDVIADGKDFVVLEANPSPMFATFDRLAGTDVAGALAECLLDA